MTNKVKLALRHAISFQKIVDAQVDFGKDETGKVTHLVLHQGGRDLRAVRTSDSVQERKEITFPRETLAKYAGVYELRPGFDIAITIEGDQLMGRATGQNKLPLFAESDTKM